jgi:hypothetical protein
MRCYNAAMEAEPPKAELPKRKRRRFQFRLGTLLIGVAILAIPMAYVGWQAKVAKRRDAIYRQLYSYSPESKRIGMICDVWTMMASGYGMNTIYSGTVPRSVIKTVSRDSGYDRGRPSAFRKFLGEPDIDMLAVFLSRDATQADVDETDYYFPTAKLYRVDGPPKAETATRLR